MSHEVKFNVDFGKFDCTGNGIKDNLIEVEVRLDRVGLKEDTLRLSICGSIWNRLRTDCISAGQNLDSLLEIICKTRDKQMALMMRIHIIWERYHLNDMKAGSPRQEAYLAGYKDATDESYDYLTSLDLLERAGLEPDPHHDDYSYGSSWLYSQIPDDVIAEIKSWRVKR